MKNKTLQMLKILSFISLIIISLNSEADPSLAGNSPVANPGTDPIMASAATQTASYTNKKDEPFITDNELNNNAYEIRLQDEKQAADNPFSLLLYHPTYLLPFYYTQMPDTGAYSQVPDNQTIKSEEVKGQISFKVPAWQEIFSTKANLFIAYTQLSYWQLYQKSAFFRETDYEPEVFFNYPLKKWLVVSTGVDHQSNGLGGVNERSWNRYDAEGVASIGNLMLDVKAWVPIFQADSSDLYNPDITNYLGYGDVIVAYKLKGIVFSLMVRNEAESGFARGAEEFTFSVPIGGHFKFYIDAFSGYGQSLIEYNHYTNGIGAGFALNDYI